MKNIKRIISIVIAFAMILGVANIPFASKAANGDGMSFSISKMYITDKKLGDAPKTYEALINISNKSPGAIIGNMNGANNGFVLEIYDAHPRLYVTTTTGLIYYDVCFKEVTLPLNTDVHLAVVHEGENTLKCYVNGELKQTLNGYFGAYSSTTNNGVAVPFVSSTGAMIIGGDHRSGNSKAFANGKIKSIALYSDIRTASEIASDVTAYGSDNMMVCYDLTKYTSDPTVIEDLSGNGFDAYFEKWLPSEEKNEVTDYDFSFVVVGDTQIINNTTTGTHKLDTLYSWIANNVESKKIEYVFGLGDITENQNDTEYTHAVNNIKKLDGLVPYSLIRGNHENSNENFSTYFNYPGYTNQIGGKYSETSLNNVWMEFSVGDLKYLVLALDYGPNDDVLNWAGGVIEEHPEHNVIITTHAYLYRDGNHLNDDGNMLAAPTKTSPKGYNNGDDMWEKLGKKYENISMILSGHDPNNDVVVTQREGENGNTVTEMLIDPQGLDKNLLNLGALPTGMVAIFYVSNGGSTIQIDYYSTIRDQYWGETETITVDVVGCEHENTTVHNKVDATCSTVGHEAYTSCDDCGAVISGVNAEIPKTAHSMTHYDEIPATPTEEGRIEYWECSLCNTKYSDAAGTQATTNLTIPAFGEELTLSGAKLALGDSIAMKFIANKNGWDKSEYKNPYVRVIIEGRETRIDGVVVDGEYVFMLDQIAAHQMDDTIYVVLCAESRGVTYSSEMYDYSVGEYCYKMLNEHADDAELRTLLVDLLNYGAAAQTYMQETGTLVNANLTDTQKAWASGNATLTNVLNKAYKTVSNPSVTWKSAGLNLSGTITLRLKVQTSDIAGLTVKVAGFDNCNATFEKISDGSYYIYIQGITLTQMSDTLDITVYNGDTAVSNTLRYSISSYAYANQSGNLGALMKALMKVGTSAKAYAQ